MPNVMGREFPYTPQGMAAAEQYKQAMGMRGGGMMGFRPLGYDNGGEVVNPLVATGMGQRAATLALEQGGNLGPVQGSETNALNPLVATGMGQRAAASEVQQLMQEYEFHKRQSDIPTFTRFLANNAGNFRAILPSLPEGMQRDIMNSIQTLVSQDPAAAAPSERGVNRSPVQDMGVAPGMTQLPGRTSPTDNTGEYLLLNPDMAPRQEMGPPEAGQPFRGGGLASLRRY